MDDHDALLRLAAALKIQDWPAQMTARGERTVLRVANPADPRLNADVVCTDADGEHAYQILDGQRLGPVSAAGDVAGALTHVLRGVGA